LAHEIELLLQVFFDLKRVYVCKLSESLCGVGYSLPNRAKVQVKGEIVGGTSAMPGLGGAKREGEVGDEGDQ
jgi:hypothetical protein